MSTATGTQASETRTRRTALERFLRDPLGAGSAVVLLIIIVASLAAPLLSPYDPNFTSLNLVFAPPSAAHPLGGDGVGRDVLARLLWGGRASLLSGAIVLVVACVLGVSLGLVAGYRGGLFDTIGNWISNALMAFPGIIILMASAAALGRSIWISMTIFGVLLSPGFYRMTRTNVRAVRNEAFVDAARVFGISPARILFRHILTVVRGPLLIQIAGAVGIAVVIQAGLDFLGLGDPTLPSWGVMLSDAFRSIYTSPLQILWPGLMIGLTAGAAALIGNSIRDVLEEGDVVRVSPAAVRAARRQQREATQASMDVMDDPNELLAAEDLRVSYGISKSATKEVVHGVNLSIRRGEVLGLVGESGSGKTQTSLAILGLLPEGGFVSGGRIMFNGLQINGLGPGEMRGILGKKIAYIPQEPMTNLDPMFSIGNQLIERLRSNTNMSRAQAATKMKGMLDRVGIADPARVMASYPHQVSGGMAQRVLIAGALATEPDLIIADEPSTALDVTVQAEVLDLLRELQRESHCAMLLVTHNFGVVADICDTVAVMQGGRIVETAAVRDIFARPQHEYTRSLLEASLEGRPSRSAREALQ
ncbi:dipeptide/oligopeptide/nickel ABC transporter permease/ATP-binding protein [Paenarthrobacter sp. 22069]|uniref:dipeptide/oligopeptide/nickel ABC transporter permease/ATP-binding protein n=1 Tax=Paenarthrobacter sp. 22069 TaxID=3453864 RepID=UPI003F863A46